MGILDDAIREHLDLKRKHGARDSEIREIEDEALGAGAPDAFTAGELFKEASPAEAPAREGGAPGPETPSASDLGEPTAGREEPTRLVEPGPMETPPSMPEQVEPPPERPEAAEPGHRRARSRRQALTKPPQIGRSGAGPERPARYHIGAAPPKLFPFEATARASWAYSTTRFANTSI